MLPLWSYGSYGGQASVNTVKIAAGVYRSVAGRLGFFVYRELKNLCSDPYCFEVKPDGGNQRESPSMEGFFTLYVLFNYIICVV